MAQLFDARGNEYQGALDQITNGTVTDPRTISATLGALNAEVIMDLNGKAVAQFDVRTGAAATLTFVFEGTFDGSNYFTLPAFVVSDSITPANVESFIVARAIAAAFTGAFTVGVSGYRRVRCRVSAYTSGSVVVTARATV